MKTGKSNSIKHVWIGTAICLATMGLFLAFGGKLPDNVPMQITISGAIGNTLPKAAVIYGLPVVFAAVNLWKGFSLYKSETSSVGRYYVIPIVAVVLSGFSIAASLIYYK